MFKHGERQRFENLRQSLERQGRIDAVRATWLNGRKADASDVTASLALKADAGDLTALDGRVTAVEGALPAKLEWTAVPASAAATGTAGQIAYESGFLYLCVATDTWQRVAVATWP